MTSDDRLDLQDLFARLCWEFDTGDAPKLVSLFAEDGVWDDRKYRTVKRGRPDIAAFFTEMVIRRKSPKFTEGQQHWNSYLVLDGDSQIARGRCYLLVLKRSAETDSLLVTAQVWYTTEFRKVDGEWRIQRLVRSPEMPYEPS